MPLRRPRLRLALEPETGTDGPRPEKLTEELYAVSLGEAEPGTDDLDEGDATAVPAWTADVCDDWQDPIAALSVPPASRIKWLNNKERGDLRNYLGAESEDTAPDAGLAESPGTGAAADREGGGLEEAQAFDLAFARTLLRADVFGAAQARLLASRRRRPLGDILDKELGAVGKDVYRAAADRYREIEEQVRREALAALAILSRCDVTAFDRLLQALAGSVVRGQMRAYIGAGLAALLDGETASEPESAAFVAEVRKARSAVQREGFRRQDEADPAWSAAFAASAEGVAGLLAELGRLTDHLARHPSVLELREDREVFRTTFLQLYR